MQLYRPSQSYLIILCALFLYTKNSFAQCTYTSVGSGDWTDPTTWSKSDPSCADYPGETQTDDIVIITATSGGSGGDHIVDLTNQGLIEIGSLTLSKAGSFGGTLNITDTDITVNGNVSLAQNTLMVVEDTDATDTNGDGVDIIIIGTLTYTDNGNILIQGDGIADNTLLVDGCADGPGTNTDLNDVTQDIVWCVDPDADNVCDGTSTTSESTPGACSDVLPVTLASFNATTHNETVKLHWVTASELNNSHFQVQKSNDGVAFENIGTVKGAGTTDLSQSYSFIDYELASSEIVFYRLKQIDFDGTFAYSPVVSVFPNGLTNKDWHTWVDANNNLKIALYQMPYAQVSVHSLSGKLIHQEQLNGISENPTITVKMNKNRNGLYLVRIFTKRGEQYTAKVFMEK